LFLRKAGGRKAKSSRGYPRAKKLIKMAVYTGDGERTIVAGMVTTHAPEDLVGGRS